MSEKKYFTKEAKQAARRLTNRKYRLANKDKERARNKLYREENKDYLDKYSLLNNARGRAVDKGLDFSITLDDFEVPLVCPVLGIPIAHGHTSRDSWPTLDRKDNLKGYVPGNVFVISYRANRIKNDATISELKLILEYMEN